MRVAVTQFATSPSTEENISTCLKVIAKTATCKPDIIVLPTFFYHKSEPSYQKNSVKFNVKRCEFVEQLGQLALKHQCYIYISLHEFNELADSKLCNEASDIKDVALHHQKADTAKTDTSLCIITPQGKLLSKKHCNQDDKIDIDQPLNTVFGQLGFLSDNDTQTFSASRQLAKAGAQLICNSIATPYYDQSAYHDPTRALENNLFIATANIVASQSTPMNDLTVNELVNDISKNDSSSHDGYGNDSYNNVINGCGQSKIISPQGEILASLNNNEAGFVYADIDLTAQTHNLNAIQNAPADQKIGNSQLVGLIHKCRPDGTAYNDQVRPELYSSQQFVNHQVMKHENSKPAKQSPATVNVAIFATYKIYEQAIDDVCHYIENNLTDIIQLPEIFFVDDKSIMANASLRSDMSLLSQLCIKKISQVLRPCQYVCTSLLVEGKHQAVLIGNKGLMASQSQLHPCNRYAWTECGTYLNTISLQLEQGSIKLAMLTGDDAMLPEVINTLAARGIQLLLLAIDIQEAGDVAYSLMSRAAEFNVCIVAASKEKNFTLDQPKQQTIYSKNKDKKQKSTGLIANVKLHAGVLPNWQTNKTLGFSEQPSIKWQFGKITKAVIHPIFAG